MVQIRLLSDTTGLAMMDCSGSTDGKSGNEINPAPRSLRVVRLVLMRRVLDDLPGIVDVNTPLLPLASVTAVDRLEGALVRLLLGFRRWLKLLLTWLRELVKSWAAASDRGAA